MPETIDLNQFTGCLDWVRHSMNPNILLSEGVVFLAKEANAWWLVDAIASHLTCTKELIRRCLQDEAFDYLHFWYLTRGEDKKDGWSSAVLRACPDDGEPPVVTQKIPLTDFPFDRTGGPKFTIYAGTDGPGTPTKLFLTSEY